jgi:hypothetical protein
VELCWQTITSVCTSPKHLFDEISKYRRIFKVETVGDRYVAVAGVSEYRKDHVVAMSCIGHDCVNKMNSLAKSEK